MTAKAPEHRCPMDWRKKCPECLAKLERAHEIAKKLCTELFCGRKACVRRNCRCQCEGHRSEVRP